jgi:nucleoside-diphosphate-sugar epimerase
MITVLGADGFLGSHVVRWLRTLGREVRPLGRKDDVLATRHGLVIDCVGVTVDFRARPLDTVEAHVARLLPILREASFSRFVYLSSTRLYHAADAATEETPLRFSPLVPGDLYDLSKALGEATVLASRRDVKIVRLSNVYGRGMSEATSLGHMLEGARRGLIVVGEDGRSEKDYLSVTTAVEKIVQIAERGRQQIYNVASGVNVTHRAIAERLAHLCGAEIQLAGELRRFPRIDVSRIADELGHRPDDVVADLTHLVDEAEALAS